MSRRVKSHAGILQWDFGPVEQGKYASAAAPVLALRCLPRFYGHLSANFIGNTICKHNLSFSLVFGEIDKLSAG
ncbi:hypothetical protein [Castellaniella caeni]